MPESSYLVRYVAVHVFKYFIWGGAGGFVFDVSCNNLANVDCDGVLIPFAILFRMKHIDAVVGWVGED